MNEYVRLEEVTKIIEEQMRKRYCLEMGGTDRTVLNVLQVVKTRIWKLDIVEAEPVRHGEWKWVFNRKADTWGDDCYESGWECSECGAGADIYISHHKVEESCEESEKGITDERTIYCHNCGAKMDLEG